MIIHTVLWQKMKQIELQLLVVSLQDTKIKNVNSVSSQTDIAMCCIEEFEEQLKSLQPTLSDKPRLKRELFLEDVMKNDDSVSFNFYTGIPTLSCLNMLENLITPEAHKIKYWDKNKDKKNEISNFTCY